MLNPIEQFRENIVRVQNLGGLHTVLDDTTTSAVDLSDILRAQIVMIVSALDLYIHEITRVGMLDVFNGSRPQTDAFMKFQVSLDSAIQGISNSSRDEWLDTEIRTRHSHLSFQEPNKIADAVRRFLSSELWPSVAIEMNLDVREVKGRLSAIVKRRNQIVHESDLDPTYPGTVTRWQISPTDVSDTLEFVQDVCEAIHIISNQS